MLQVLDDHRRVYHSRTRLTELATEVAVKGESPQSSVLDLALDVPGVSMGQVLAYAMMVEKAVMWEWAEIEPALLRIFATLNGEFPDEAEIVAALQELEA